MLKALNLRPLYGLTIILGSWLIAGCGEESKPTTPPANTPPPAGPGGAGGAPEDAAKPKT
jgi:hypothetical protein